jgi:VanZ family protein
MTRLRRIALPIYTALIIYGSLFPFYGWRMPAHLPWPFDPAAPLQVSKTDVFANVLLYIPLGALMTAGRRRKLAALLGAIVATAALSIIMETSQWFLPDRVSSALDIAMNTTGGLLGAVGATLLRGRWQHHIGDSWQSWIATDRLALLGAAALAAWVCAQLIPFAPSLDVGALRHGLKPLYYTLTGRTPISGMRLVVYLTAVAGLMPLATYLLRLRHAFALATLLFLAVIPLKALVIDRQLSAEAAFGILGGLLLAGLIRLLAPSRQRACAVVLIIASVVAAELHPGTGNLTHAINWIPFREHLTHRLSGLMNLADTVWPWLALAFFWRQSRHAAPSALTALATFAVAAGLAALEYAQHFIPGRYPDITDVLVGTGAWVAGTYWVHTALHSSQPERHHNHGSTDDPSCAHAQRQSLDRNFLQPPD